MLLSLLINFLMLYTNIHTYDVSKVIANKSNHKLN